MKHRMPLTVLLVALALPASAVVASAQYAGNPGLRNPGATTPVPKQAGKPPQTWEPAAQPTPAARQLNPNPGCVTLPCNAPPVIRKPAS